MAGVYNGQQEGDKKCADKCWDRHGGKLSILDADLELSTSDILFVEILLPVVLFLGYIPAWADVSTRMWTTDPLNLIKELPKFEQVFWHFQ